MPPMEESSHVQNVILFGESGVGKSSIINLIVGSEVAKTSPDADACTTRTRPYNVTIYGKAYKLWDTVGLDGGSFGLFRAVIAKRNLKSFLQNLFKKKEPCLLLYCVRASRATCALVRHYQSVYSTMRGSLVRIPMVIVVTGLENARGDMETWWYRNATELSNHGMVFADHACITSIDDNPLDVELARARRTNSQDIIRDLIYRNYVSPNSRERYGNAPQQPARRQGDSKGWTSAVWTYVTSTVFTSET